MAVGKGRTAGKRVLAGLAVIGIFVIAGLVAAWGVSPGEARRISRAMSPADVVALRFPADWTDGEVAATAPLATYALASAEQRPYDGAIDSAMMFSPNPINPIAAAAAPQPIAVAALSSESQPALQAEPQYEAKAEPKPAPKAEPKAKPVAVATRALAPAHHPAPHRPKDSGVLFNNAQLASIKARLKLSDYQQQYWPAVAAALHALGERAARAPVRATTAYASEGPLAGIDPDGPEVQQLKSAAFPLIMSMNDEQKDQVRMLAHVMGLEQVATSF